jgi:hypothetical protein
MSRRKHILFGFGIAIIIAGAYLWLFGVQSMCALTVRYWSWKMPVVARTPVELSDSSTSNTQHKKEAYFGYEFEIPWDDADEQKDRTVGSIHVSAFQSGNAFWFSTFPPKDLVNGIMKTAHLEPGTLRQFYGEDATQSDYSFKRKMLQTTPREITPFVSRKQAVAGQMMLLVKALSISSADAGIFSIRTADFQGFQFGSPQSRPYKITAELYSSDGGIDLIFFQKVGGSAASISQAEINRIIQSIHKTSASVVASNVPLQK